MTRVAGRSAMSHQQSWRYTEQVTDLPGFKGQYSRYGEGVCPDFNPVTDLEAKLVHQAWCSPGFTGLRRIAGGCIRGEGCCRGA